MGDTHKPSFVQALLGRTVRYSLLVAAVAALLFIILQMSSKYLLRQWLLENGANSVAIEKMYLNPFTGRLTLNGVDIEKSGEIVYSDDIFHLNISMSSLFDRDIHVEQAVLRDMLIDIHRDDSGVLSIGSYRLQSGEKQKTEEDFSPWTLQAEEVDLSNVIISYRQDEVDLQLVIDNGSARGFSSSTNEESSRVTLSGHLNGAPLEVELSGFLLEPFFSLSGKLKLSEFSLQDLEGFLSRQLSALDGTLSTAGSFSFENRDNERFSWRFDGTAEALETALGGEGLSVSGDLGWNGKISHEKFSAEKTAIGIKGVAAARSLRYRDKKTALAAGLQAFSAEGAVQLEMTEKVSISSDISLSFSEVDAAGEKGRLSSSAASWQGIADYSGSGDGKEQKFSTDGNIVVDELFLAVPGTVEVILPHFTSVGKSEIVMADGFTVAYDGETTAEETDLTAGEYSLSSADMTYRGVAGYEVSEEGAAVVYIDGSLAAEKTGTGFKAQQLRWNQGNITVDGDFTVELKSEQFFAGTAALTMEDGRLLEDEEIAVTLDSLIIEQIKSDDSGNLRIPAVDSGPLAINSSERIPFSLNLETVRLEEITVTRMENFKIGSILLQELNLPAAGSQQLGLAASAVVVSEVAGSNQKDLAIDAVRAVDVSLPSVGGERLDLSASVLEISQVASENLEGIEVGAVRVEDISLPSVGEVRLDLSASVLEISDIVTNLENLAVAGITMQEIALPASGDRELALALDSLSIGPINSGNLQEYTVEVVQFEQPLLSKSLNGERLIAMEDITARQISGQGGREVRVAQIIGGQAGFLTDPLLENDAPLASLAGIEVSELSWSQEQGTHIQSVVGESLQGEYTRKEEAGEEAPGEQEKTEEDQGPTEIPLRIDSVTLNGSNELKYSDSTKADPFTAVLTIDSLEIADINLADPGQSLTYEVVGSVDKYSPLTASGSAAPWAEPRLWEQQLHLRGYPVENLSSFSIELIGARLTGGKLELESQLEIQGDFINMDNRLIIDEISTKTVEADRLRQFNRRLPIPLDTALSFMQEDGIVTLTIPIEGSLSELDINYNDIIVTALSNSIATAVQPLLAYSVLGPGGVLAYLGLQIGQKLINTELPELIYEQNNAELTDEHKRALNEVGERLAERVREQEDASYYIYPRVAPGEVSESGEASLLDEKQRQELYELGERRARRVKSYLLQNFDIEEKNLLIFQPGILYDGESQGMISFMK
ncbi:DUF748 domain-containing protein [Desulfopila inferna]|uniref:DUF748 domain-containing protein n=1 Tax=Desulfopila inferna TaxID=468528 RepID=UPI001964202D|nr:DUF748 domain-containing protein [Desulfopila inferna]MBM9605015.1 DUF748 domain-containing protein [Desulfopila inferna]